MARTSSPIRAPEFPPGLEWLNTDRPLTLKELRGKVVLLDFWTYCCINCMHMGARLRRLEEKWREEVVLVGVHAAKFPSERLTANILQAARRHRLRHPIVNDWNFKIWEQYTVRAWPTVAVIDAEGYLSAQEQGEVAADILDHMVERAVERAEILRILKRSAPSGQSPPDDRSRLAYPGKLLARDGRLYVADSLHDRIVVCDADSGRIERVYGFGGPGFVDGPSAAARFQNPQGMALAEGFLYVAEPENHAVRRIHLESGNVRTVAGTGRQAAYLHGGGPALEVDLSSPWDLAWHDGALYVAMAGFHQIWRLDLSAGRVAAVAGTGREGLRDGPREEAWLAQPSSLSVRDGVLFFADAESSAVRSMRLDGGPVTTLVGRGLFEYGDVDGVGDGVRLQHPMALAATDGALYVADSYNNRIKRLAPGTRSMTSWAGDGVSGHRDGDTGAARFYEPSGLAVDSARLYVADTNNHAVRVVDLESDMVSTLPLPPIA